MATEEAPSFDDLDPVESPEANDDERVIKLDAGEAIVAEVRHVEPNVGKFDNTVLHLTQEGDPCRTWSNATIDRQLDAADVRPGETIGIRKS